MTELRIDADRLKRDFEALRTLGVFERQNQRCRVVRLRAARNETYAKRHRCAGIFVAWWGGSDQSEKRAGAFELGAGEFERAG